MFKFWGLKASVYINMWWFVDWRICDMSPFMGLTPWTSEEKSETIHFIRILTLYAIVIVWFPPTKVLKAVKKHPTLSIAPEIFQTPAPKPRPKLPPNFPHAFPHNLPHGLDQSCHQKILTRFLPKLSCKDNPRFSERFGKKVSTYFNNANKNPCQLMSTHLNFG